MNLKVIEVYTIMCRAWIEHSYDIFLGCPFEFIDRAVTFGWKTYKSGVNMHSRLIHEGFFCFFLRQSIHGVSALK